MFNGPSRQHVGPVAEFGIGEPGTLLEGTGIAYPNYRSMIVSQFVGLGNFVQIFCYLDLLIPANPTDIKWVDVATFYQNGAYAPFRWPERDDDDLVSHIASNYCTMDSVAERDPQNPGTNIISKRWRVYRLPNLRDPDNIPPLHQHGSTVIRYNPVIIEPAAADYLNVYIHLVALDSNENAVLRVGETIQLGAMPGGFASSP